MKILKHRVYEGKNIYSHKKCIRLDVELGKYSEIPSKDIEGFNENLINIVPELKKVSYNPLSCSWDFLLKNKKPLINAIRLKINTVSKIQINFRFQINGYFVIKVWFIFLNIIYLVLIDKKATTWLRNISDVFYF